MYIHMRKRARDTTLNASDRLASGLVAYWLRRQINAALGTRLDPGDLAARCEMEILVSEEETA